MDEIGWQKNENGTYSITPKKDGSVVGTRGMMANLTLKQVEDYVGKNQENLRNVLGHATETKNIDSAFLSDHDSAFMNELYQLMEKELSNSELNITRITEVMHISTRHHCKRMGRNRLIAMHDQT